MTNGDDGLFIHVGDAITWTYTVTNTGNVPLSGVWVDDDMLVANPVLQAKTATTGDPDDDGILDLDEAWIYTATGVATANDPASAYENTGTAYGTGPADDEVEDPTTRATSARTRRSTSTR